MADFELRITIKRTGFDCDPTCRFLKSLNMWCNLFNSSTYPRQDGTIGRCTECAVLEEQQYAIMGSHNG